MKKRLFIVFIPLVCVLVFLTTVKSSNTNNHSETDEVFSDSTASFARGKSLYKTHCLSCHQFDGGGVENMNPPLIQTSYVLGNKARLINIVLKGFNKRVDIGGDTYSNNMPPLAFLTNQQIADVLTYVRNDFGNKASVVKVTDVKSVRGGAK